MTMHASGHHHVALARALALMSALLLTAYSLAPFDMPDQDRGFGLRVQRFASPDAAAIGPPVELAMHWAAFAVLGALVGANWAGATPIRGAAWAILTVAPLACAIEAAQLLLPDRHAHLADLACNILGTAMGGSCVPSLGEAGRGLRLRLLGHRRLMYMLASAVVTAAIMALLIVPAALWINLDAWNDSFPLLVGNEAGGHRPWLGDIRLLAIYSTALDAERCRERWRRCTEALDVLPTGEPGLLAAWDFNEEPTRRIAASGPASAPAILVREPSHVDALGAGGLRLTRPTKLVSQRPPTEIIRAIKAADAFSVEVWCRPASAVQTGPARIAGISRNSSVRNFMLGQRYGGLSFRVATPVTGPNGADPPFYVGGQLLVEQGYHHIVGAYSHGASRLYLDGRLLPRQLNMHAPAVIMKLGASTLSHAFAAAILVVPVLMCTAGLAPRGRAVGPLVGGLAFYAVVAAGLAGRLLLTGHPPDYATWIWAAPLIVILAPVVQAHQPACPPGVGIQLVPGEPAPLDLS